MIDHSVEVIDKLLDDKVVFVNISEILWEKSMTFNLIRRKLLTLS